MTRAADFAARRLRDQVRKASAREPYLNHLSERGRACMRRPPRSLDASLVAGGLAQRHREDTATERRGAARSASSARDDCRRGRRQTVTRIDKSLRKGEQDQQLQIETAPVTEVVIRAQGCWKQLRTRSATSALLMVSPPARPGSAARLDRSRRLGAKRSCDGLSRRQCRRPDDSCSDQTLAKH